tara:strand:+ start:5524 stop:6159 length:636 start_codon:yes stop_codon:yes gene_type:complete
MYNFFLILHIICGTLALISAAGSLLTKKGRKQHARFGKVYSSAMMGVAITSTILVSLGGPIFLLFVGIFSAYLVAVGWRLAVNRKGVFTNVDRSLISFGILAIFGLSVSAIDYFLSGENFGFVPLTFAIITTLLVVRQIRRDEKNRGPIGKARITQHVIFMGAGTIATVTAFLLTVISDSILIWLSPTVVGSLLITWYSRSVMQGKIVSKQ